KIPPRPTRKEDVLDQRKRFQPRSEMDFARGDTRFARNESALPLAPGALLASPAGVCYPGAHNRRHAHPVRLAGPGAANGRSLLGLCPGPLVRDAQRHAPLILPKTAGARRTFRADLALTAGVRAGGGSS